MMATVNVYASNNNNNNNREFIECFRRLKALYNLRKQQQHNAQIAIYKSVEYNEANNTFKKKITIIFMKSMAKHSTCI